MKEFIEVLQGVCTVGGLAVVFIPMTNFIPVKWFVLSIIIALIIIFWLITIIFDKEEDIIDSDKVYITDIKFDKSDTIIYFQENKIYHVDALVCIYEDTIPDSTLVAFGEVVYCENNYTKIKVIKTIDKECFKKFKNNRKEMDGKIYAITSFKKSYIELLN